MIKYFITALIILGFFKNGIAQVPDWQWGKSGGGISNEGINQVAIDSLGNSYNIGSFRSATISFGSFILTNTNASGTSNDMFIVKYDAEGNVLWAKSAGGNYDDLGISVALDRNGEVYVTGNFRESITFDTILLTDVINNKDFFLVKYDTSGQVIWAKKGVCDLVGNTFVAADQNGNLYLAGYFGAPVIIIDGTTLINSDTVNLAADMFIAKFDSFGSLQWAKSTYGLKHEAPQNIKCDNDGNIYITGSFSSSTFILDSVILSVSDTIYYTSDVFIAKFNTNGDCQWARSSVGDGSQLHNDDGRKLALDNIGNVYLAGIFFSDSINFQGTIFTNGGPSGAADIFLIKYDSIGNLIWAKSLQHNGQELNVCLTIGSSSNLYLTGTFYDSISVGNTILFNRDTSGTYIDLFVIKYDSSGNTIWATSAGGLELDCPLDIVSDLNGNILITGFFESPDLTFGSSTLSCIDTTGTYGDAFIAKLGTCYSHFFLYPDSAQSHHYYAVNQAMGIPPLQYDWSWGDGNHDYTAYPSHVYADSGYYDICLTINDSIGCSSTYCDSSFYLARGTSSGSMVYVNVVDQIVTTLTEKNVNNDLCIAPNPAISKLTISSPMDAILSLEIFGITGELIFYDLTPSNIFSVEVSVENWNQGIYFLKVQTEKGNDVKKIIKE